MLDGKSLSPSPVIRCVWLLVVVALAVPMRSGACAAPDDADLWSAPTNLSRSGAATAPVLIAGSGALQAFWWDHFDGLTTARYDSEAAAWGPSAAAPILIPRVVGTGDTAEFVVEPLDEMPQIVANPAGFVHALWLGPPNEETGLRPLLTSRLSLGTTTWSSPDIVAESASAWVLSATPSGTLHLGYVRPAESDAFPPGLYYRRATDNGAIWSPAQLLLGSRYLRLYTAEQLHLALHAADEGGVIAVAWDDPRLGTALMATSSDDGATWSAPTPLGAEASTRPRFLTLGGGASFVLWESASAFVGCEFWQQPLTFTGTHTTSPARVLAELELTNCPAALRTLPGNADDAAAVPAETESGPALLVAGEGSAALTLMGWDDGATSLPRALTFAFTDPETGAHVTLSDLRAARLASDRLVVIGRGALPIIEGSDTSSGDIWAFHTTVGALELAFAPPSPWSDSAPIAESAAPGPPAGVFDADGQLHLLWRAGDELHYSRRDAATGAFSLPVALATGGVGDPALLVQGDRLHAVWAQGPGGLGMLVHRSAYTRDATAESGWSEPLVLSQPGLAGGAAALLADDGGALHAVFTVPLNEGRGLYYTRSGDQGEHWSTPVAALDAASPREGATPWSMVGAVALAADSAGTLYVALVEGDVAGPFPPRALWTLHSTDGGERWSVPAFVAEGTVAHPRIILAGEQLLVLWHNLDRSTIAFRTSTDGGRTWSYQQAVPGFHDTQGPTALFAMRPGGALTLVGLTRAPEGDDADGFPQVMAWDGARWAPVATAPWSALVQTGISVVQDPGGDALHLLAWTSGTDMDATPTLIHSAFQWDAADASAGTVTDADVLIPIAPTATPLPTVTPQPMPTPRPTVVAAAPAPGVPVLEAGPLTLPLTAIAGIAGSVLVVAAAALIAGRRR